MRRELKRVARHGGKVQLILAGKSDEIGRSYGFFVYILGRLINVDDGHFGIDPNELRHGTFGRFRLVINIDSLDAELRANPGWLAPSMTTGCMIAGRALFGVIT